MLFEQPNDLSAALGGRSLSAITDIHTFLFMQNATMKRAWDLPPSTFGGAYAKFMGDRNFQADERCVLLLDFWTSHSLVHKFKLPSPEILIII